jgi:hypothetical protein
MFRCKLLNFHINHRLNAIQKKHFSIIINPKIHDYATWSILHTFVNSVDSIISTNSFLSKISINTMTQSQSQSFLFTYNYFMKDIFGQLGGLFIIHKTSKFADKYPLHYGMYSNVVFQFAVLLECSLLFIPFKYFIFITIGTTILKNIAFINFSAINVKCIQCIVEENSQFGIASIYSHISIINTIFSSMGMMTGLILLYYFPNTIFYILPITSMIRFYSYNKMIKTVLH